MSYTSTLLNRLVLKRVGRELANDSMLFKYVHGLMSPLQPLSAIP